MRRLQPAKRAGIRSPRRIEEWRAVADCSAAMVAQELEYDPRRGWSGVRRRHPPNDRTQALVGRHRRRQASASSATSVRGAKQTVQLQGIWTPPELRGRGLASASLAAICDRLFDVFPTLSLYVNDFNEPAIALYRRVGFEHVGDFQTMLF